MFSLTLINRNETKVLSLETIEQAERIQAKMVEKGWISKVSKVHEN